MLLDFLAFTVYVAVVLTFFKTLRALKSPTPKCLSNETTESHCNGRQSIREAAEACSNAYTSNFDNTHDLHTQPTNSTVTISQPKFLQVKMGVAELAELLGSDVNCVLPSTKYLNSFPYGSAANLKTRNHQQVRYSSSNGIEIFRGQLWLGSL